MDLDTAVAQLLSVSDADRDAALPVQPGEKMADGRAQRGSAAPGWQRGAGASLSRK